MIEVLHQAPKDLRFDSLAQLNGIRFDDRFMEAFAKSFREKSIYADEQAKRLNYRFKQDCVVRTNVVFSPFPFSDTFRAAKSGPVWDALAMQESYDDIYMTLPPPEAFQKRDFQRSHFLDRRPVPCSVEMWRQDDGSVDLTFHLSVERTIVWRSDAKGWDLLVDSPELARFGGDCAARVLLDWFWVKSSGPAKIGN